MQARHLAAQGEETASALFIKLARIRVQRWFEPAKPLPNVAGTPHTGDFIDAFGNKVRVLAVANPRVTFKEYRQHHTGRGQGLGDRRLKSEGYGIIRVNRARQEFELECWFFEGGNQMALEMRTKCEKCEAELAAVDEAYICSYERTFCANCTSEMKAICPNCGGKLVRRPQRISSECLTS